MPGLRLPAPESLHEQLSRQWGLVDAADGIKNAGSEIIDYIDDRGFLTVRLEQLHNKDRADFSFEDLQKALKLVQGLEPSGVGARDLRECLLIQLVQRGQGRSFHARLISECMDELLDNRLPCIARKWDCSIEEVNPCV